MLTAPPGLSRSLFVDEWRQNFYELLLLMLLELIVLLMLQLPLVLMIVRALLLFLSLV